MKKLFIFVFMLLTISAFAQDRPKFLYAEFADKSVTTYPFYTVFGDNFDPAVTLGYGLDYKQKGNLTLFQTFQITGYSSYFIGNGITLTSSLGYRYSHHSGIFGEAMTGLGTSAFFPSKETFAQNEDHIYEPVNPLIIRATLPFDFVLGYTTGRFAVYLKYRYMFLGPYTDVYMVPFIAVSQTGIGIRYLITNPSVK